LENRRGLSPELIVKIALLHPALCAVGGAEVLMVEHAMALTSAGASVRIRTAIYDPAYWATRVGEIPVESLALRVPGEKARVPSTQKDHRVRWVLEGIERARLAIAHNYPMSSALGDSGANVLKIWYCHEPPRSLYPREASPFLWEHAASAPERDGPSQFLASTNSWFSRLPVFGRRRPARLAADRKGIRTLDAVWANSEFTRDNVRRVYGSVPAEVVYPTVDLPSPKPRSGAREGGLRVLSLTRLHWVKNLDTLVDGFAAFRKRDDPRAELHIVGEGPLRRPLEERVSNLGLSGAVKVHGFLDEAALEELSARCDAFACVPLDEPFGMVFPEAMTRGLLVLGPNHGGPLEILDGGRLGEAVDALSAEALADGLARIARLSNAEADERRLRAAASVKQRFSRAATLSRMQTLLASHGLELGA
jgi:glycosyltransferase involved in cell wall biosynthesis